MGVHKGEIQRVEEENQVLALVIRQRDLLELLIGHHRLSGKRKENKNRAPNLNNKKNTPFRQKRARASAQQPWT